MAQGTAAVGLRETASSCIRRYFDAAADRLGLHAEMRKLLSVPFRELTVELPLRRDDGRLQLFRGYRVQHNGVRGPLIGPICFQSGLELETLRAAAESMTWRCAVANVPFGGAAGGVACDQAQLSRSEFERLVRRYGARLREMFGIYQDVCAPGLNTGSDAMSWIAEEYSALQKNAVAPVIGKLPKNGGLPDSDGIVGRSIAALVARAGEDAGMFVPGLRVAVGSLDRSAFHTASALNHLGCTIVAIFEERGGLRCSTGIDMQSLADHLRGTGSLAGYEGAAETIDVHALDCDALVLGAPEGTLNTAAAAQVRARLVVETSELVVTPDADHYFAKQGVLVIPDLVGGCAAVLAANAEWWNNVQRLAPKEETIRQEVNDSLLRAYEQVCERSRREHLGLRMAAYSLAIERVARCERLRLT
ncbi:MAG TPA: Glu/Leu/Phe/Val dehydrogenase dimerization domain-containing protein [Terriglobales bacterium]|jgi:glutamate dehydrogenase (NAD(P)+)|nr:Glu/Leu/Phe/Val dehydrogenase dimerization domain-containing protein [Terriglobales bacterium]